MQVGKHNLQAEVPYDISKDMELELGKEVYLIIKLKRIKAYECHRQKN